LGVAEGKGDRVFFFREKPTGGMLAEKEKKGANAGDRV